MGPEATIERKVAEWCRRHGVRSWKISGPNNRGAPDREFGRGGRVCYVEFKAPGKKPTALQEKTLQGLRDDGFRASWFDDADKAIAWLERKLFL